MGKQKVSRQLERIAAMKLIYEWEMGGDGGYETLNMVYELEGAPQEPVVETEEAAESVEPGYVENTVQGVIDRAEMLDGVINAHSVGWKTERMPKVDLAILRLGVYELLQKKEPVPVIINEAVQLANVYCADKSGAFVNGVLGAISRDPEMK